jgi:hypothetical protein
VDFKSRSFLAWNPRFLEQTGFSEDEVRLSKPEELFTFSDSWIPLSEKTDGQRVEYAICTAKRPDSADCASGYAVRSQGRIGYLMIDDFASPSAQFEEGREEGREEENTRIRKRFHEEVSSPMIAALFLIETAKIELEAAGLPQAEVVAKASDILTETTEKIALVIGEAGQNAKYISASMEKD